MKNFTVFILFFVANAVAFAQSNNATLRGKITDTENLPLDMVTIVLKEYPTLGTTTNAKGEFLLRIPAKKQLTILFSSIGYKTFSDDVFAQANETIIKNIVMPAQNLELAEIVVKEQRRSNGNLISLDPKILNSNEVARICTQLSNPIFANGDITITISSDIGAFTNRSSTAT